MRGARGDEGVGVPAGARDRRVHRAVRRPAGRDGQGHAARQAGRRALLAHQRLRDRPLEQGGRRARGRRLSGWRVTVRTGPKVERVAADTLEEALDALELHARAAANTERRAPVDMHVRRYEPGDQGAVRAAPRGPGVHAGVDVRGDGSVGAWTGRVRRKPIEAAGDETPYDALRRFLQSTSVDP